MIADRTLEGMIGARIRDAWRVEYDEPDWERLLRIEAALDRLDGMTGLRSALRTRLLTEWSNYGID